MSRPGKTVASPVVPRTKALVGVQVATNEGRQS